MDFPTGQPVAILRFIPATAPEISPPIIHPKKSVNGIQGGEAEGWGPS